MQSYLNRTYYIMAVTYNIDNTEKLVFITNEIHNSVLKYEIYVSLKLRYSRVNIFFGVNLINKR